MKSYPGRSTGTKPPESVDGDLVVAQPSAAGYPFAP